MNYILLEKNLQTPKNKTLFAALPAAADKLDTYVFRLSAYVKMYQVPKVANLKKFNKKSSKLYK